MIQRSCFGALAFFGHSRCRDGRIAELNKWESDGQNCIRQIYLLETNAPMRQRKNLSLYSDTVILEVYREINDVL